MPALRSILRARNGFAKVAVIAAAAVGLAGVAGCGGDEANLDRGRALFTQHCGECHALAQAGTASQIGPDLDAAFVDARESGMTDATVEAVVRDQIAVPRRIREDHPNYERVFMPADLVTGQDADDVSAYVGSVAGVPGIEPPALGGPEEIFVERCGSCHALSAAGTTGETGPDLDEVLPGQDAEMVEESIVNPSAELTQGFTDQMPDVFGEQIPPEDLAELVRYLLQNAGGGQG